MADRASGTYLKLFHKDLIKQRVEDDSGRFFDLGKHPIELLHRPYQGIDVLDRHDFGVLRGCSPADGNQSLAGSIGDQMKVKIARRFGHCGGRNRLDNLSTTREKATAFRGMQADWLYRLQFCPHPCRARVKLGGYIRQR